MVDQPYFDLMPFNQIKLGAGPRYLVKGLVPFPGQTLLYGAPKVGKSFLVFDLVMHVALGRSYRGLAVMQGPVVYVAAEGEHGFRARKEAFRIAKMEGTPEDAVGEQQVPFYLVAAPVDMINDHEALIRLIRQRLGDVSPVAVVLDTVNRTMLAPENSDQGMRAYIQSLDAVRDSFGCSVIAVHHCGVEGNRPRGHSSLTGAADAQLFVLRARHRMTTLSVEHMKDGADGAVLAFELAPVVVGKDADGDDITSCVVVPVVGTFSDISVGPKLMPQVQKALDLLRSGIEEEGKPAPKGRELSSSVRGIIRKRWRELCKDNGLSESDSPDAFKKAFLRARNALVEADIIGILDCGFVYLVQNEGREA